MVTSGHALLTTGIRPDLAHAFTRRMPGTGRAIRSAGFSADPAGSHHRSKPHGPSREEGGAVIDSRPPTEANPRWSFPPEPDTPGRARRCLDGVLGEWGVPPDDRWPVLLVMNELVTNAVEHAGTPLLLALNRTDDGLRIEVHDESSAPPELRDPDGLSRRGHGLRVVQDLALRWSWTETSDGKTVWATMNFSDAGGDAGATNGSGRG